MWSPQAQFAGYYVAKEKGLYQEYGLDVNILQGGPNYNPADMLKDKKVDFCLMWLSSAIQRRTEGLNLVNIAQIVRHSSLMLVARKSSEILKLVDMNGRKVSLWEGDLRLQPRALFSKHKISPEILTQSYTVNLFLAGGTDVTSAMWYNEYHTLLNSGLDEEELTTFFFRDFGLDFPEDGIYALDDTLRKDPQAAAAFVNASIAGWQYAFSNVEEAVEIVLRYMRKAKIPANRVHQRWMLTRMKDLILSQHGQIAAGAIDHTVYEKVVLELQEQSLITSIPPFSDFYRAVDTHAQE
jgi:NitT/TauT family transport system substrate-binding protein